MPIPVAVTELIGTFLEVLYYGVYLVVLPQCATALRRKRAGVTVIYFSVTLLVSFLLITLHLVVDLYRAFLAFTANMDVPGAPEKFYANVNTSMNLTKNSAYVSVTLLADLVLLYRTFIVWGRNVWIIVIPALVFIVDFGMSVWCTWSVHEAIAGKSVLTSTVFARLKYFFIATLVLNLLCTGLIAYKIWSTAHKVAGYSRVSTGSKALSIILESASIYSALSVVLIGTSATGSSTMFFFLNSIPPVIGSVFSFVILRSSTDTKRFAAGTIGSSGTYPLASHTIGRTPIKQLERNNCSVGTEDYLTDGHGVRVHLDTVVHDDFGRTGNKGKGGEIV